MSFILFYHTHIASIISLIQSQLLHFTAFTLQFLLSMTFFPLSFAWLCPSHSDLSSNINSSRALSMSSCLILLAFPNTIPSPCYQLYVTYLKYSYLLTCTIMVCFFPQQVSSMKARISFSYLLLFPSPCNCAQDIVSTQ